MGLVTPPKPLTRFVLRTTKPFHNRDAANRFFDLIDSCGPSFRPVKFGQYEPLKQIYNPSNREELIRGWFNGLNLTQEELETHYHEGDLFTKGRAPSKFNFSVLWHNWTKDVLFNVIWLTISKPFLQKKPEHMAQFLQLCDDLVRLFPPVHAELYDYTSSIPCTCCPKYMLPDDLSVRCPALKWRTYFGPPYIELLGRDTLLNAPCYKTEEVGDTIVVQLTETVFEDIPQALRQTMIDYFEGSVDPALRAELGTDFIFRPFLVTQPYARNKKLVPEFPIQECFGRKMDLEAVAKSWELHPIP